MNKQNPPKWHQVYQGTNEKRFFVGIDGKSGLVRSRSGEGKQQTWRSVKGLAADSGLSLKRVEEVIAQYMPAGVVLNNAKNPELWGYWENVGLEEAPKSLSDSDKEERVNKVTGTLKASKAQPAAPAPGPSNGNGATSAPPAPAVP